MTNGFDHVSDGFDTLRKRELFSAMAMQGILASTYGGNSSPEEIVGVAVVMADALIKELNKTKL
jgi:hypothetical protein